MADTEPRPDTIAARLGYTEEHEAAVIAEIKARREASTAPVTRCPPWLLALVAKVEWYENVHAKLTDADECFGEALAAIPSEVRAQAAGYEVARREANRG